MGDRCTGACCEELAITGVGRTVDEVLTFVRGRGLDGPFIADMLVPLRAVVPGALAPNGDVVQVEPDGGGWVFACRHFDAAARSCTVYDRRPRMCRDYPYGSPCLHGRCTWGAGRSGAWPRSEVRYEDVPEPGRAQGDARRVVHLRVLSVPAG